jgi:hypothetical protein
VVLLFSFPNLSDDIYRFIWDGKLTLSGINPYQYLPTEVLSMNAAGVDSQLFEQLNSPNYYTIYPPISQAMFYLSAKADSWAGSALILKVFFVVAEIFTFLGVYRLLQHFKVNRNHIGVYFLNPLIVIEGIGNLHFEVIMICFFVWSLVFLIVHRSWVLGAVFWSFSIATKLMPLMFLPVIWWHYGDIKRASKRKERFMFMGLLIFLLLILFSPVLLSFYGDHFASSIDLYFQKFEFNASIYYLLRYLGFQWSGYNLIAYLGPLLGLTALCMILFSSYTLRGLPSFWKSRKTWFMAYFASFFLIYLFSTTTVHPWYLCFPILFPVFIENKTIPIWSFLIMGTYMNYSFIPYSEQLWYVCIEYVTVGTFLLIEIKKASAKNAEALSY